MVTVDIRKPRPVRLATLNRQIVDPAKRFQITYSGLRGVLFTTLRHLDMTDFHIHDLRHDFASQLLRSSRNLALVQKALGHSDIKSTFRYAHVLVDDFVEAMTVPENVPESIKCAQLLK